MFWEVLLIDDILVEPRHLLKLGLLGKLHFLRLLNNHPLRTIIIAPLNDQLIHDKMMLGLLEGYRVTAEEEVARMVDRGVGRMGQGLRE